MKQIHPMKSKVTDGIVKSILTAHMVLVLHIFLVALLGLLVLFFRGVVQYMFLIFIAALLGTGFIVFRLIRRMIKEGKSVRQMLKTPLLEGRSVEVSLLGGIASVRLGKPQSPPSIEGPDSIRSITDATNHEKDNEIRDLVELARLFENDLITPDEYARAKQKILEHGR